MSRILVVIAVFALIAANAPSASGQGYVCSECSGGEHWIDGCSAGVDAIANNGAVVGIDTDFDCVANSSFVLDGQCGLLNVNRSDPRDDSIQFPGLRPVDGHLDVIDTEIVSLCLNNDDGIILRAGQGQGGITAASLGAIAELPADNTTGRSFFEVYFEVHLGGGQYVYNQEPLLLEADIRCVPPQITYVHPTGCLALYTAPTGGVHVANLVSALHMVNIIEPTLSEYAMILLAVLLVGVGLFFVVRRRRRVGNTA